MAISGSGLTSVEVLCAGIVWLVRRFFPKIVQFIVSSRIRCFHLLLPDNWRDSFTYCFIHMTTIVRKVRFYIFYNERQVWVLEISIWRNLNRALCGYVPGLWLLSMDSVKFSVLYFRGRLVAVGTFQHISAFRLCEWYFGKAGRVGMFWSFCGFVFILTFLQFANAFPTFFDDMAGFLQY